MRLKASTILLKKITDVIYRAQE